MPLDICNWFNGSCFNLSASNVVKKEKNVLDPSGVMRLPYFIRFHHLLAAFWKMIEINLYGIIILAIIVIMFIIMINI